ncbi:hypothetical protein [Pararhodobacter sp. CCB-MM2]|uniref:hypothetical protein n=1 Tax=Pararhodobacter sp. CCB-MM2 TaxID=1786003 RepID=UPI00350F228A
MQKHPREIAGIVADHSAFFRLSGPKAQNIIPIVDVEEPQPVSADHSHLEGQEIQQKPHGIMRLAQRFWATCERYGRSKHGWLVRLRGRKPRMVAAVALANKMARGLWAMMTKQEDYRNPAATMA